MTDTLVTTIESTIEHLDFEYVPPCELRWVCPRTAPLPAKFRMDGLCPFCLKAESTLTCPTCWQGLLLIPSWTCRGCNHVLGHITGFTRIYPLNI